MNGPSIGAVALLGAGFLFLWSGYHGAHVTGSLRDLLAGKQPPGGSGDLAIGGTAAAAGGGVSSAGGQFSHGRLEQLWAGSGGDPGTANVAAAVAMAESGGRAGVTSPNPDGGVNAGLWQLDTRGKGAGYTVAQLQDPQVNARVTIMGSANGTDWSAWAAYGSGAYRQYLGASLCSGG